MTWDDAIAQLFRAPHAEFVTERKRLASELKTAGDKEGAGKMAKLGRPPISAWAVNQLWWTARALFDEMLAAAKRVRESDLTALPAHKAAVAKLRVRAAEILTEAGNAAADATLRKIDTTLSAIAVSGGFDPDPPGALTDDRDPPGFASLGIPSTIAAPPAPSVVPQEAPAPKATKAEKAKAKDEEAEAKAAAAREKAEEKERERKEAALRVATKEVDRLRADTERLEAELDRARAALETAERHLEELE